MIRAMYNGTSGMNASQQALATISNNIANSQTIAFKSQQTQFEEVFYQQMKSPSSPGSTLSGTNPSDIGNGVRVGSISANFTQGSVNNTGGKTDVAIQGDGFFIVAGVEGTDSKYTRAGNFEVSKNNELVSKTGHYVMGWNMDEYTGEIRTGASLEPLKVPLGKVGEPKESTMATLGGNLDRSVPNGDVYGMQIPSWDRLGGKHDVDVSFIKTASDTFRYIALPGDQFRPSASIERAIMRPSEGIANSIIKGDYAIDVAPSVTPGMSDITVIDPMGNVILSRSVTDVDQTVTLGDGTNDWFTIDYKGGGGTTSASVTVGEAGDIQFDSVGGILNTTGSGVGGKPLISYTPIETGQPVNIDINFDGLTALSADHGVVMKDTDGYTSSTLTTYSISDNGVLQGYYDDGTVREIGQIATATFDNISGLTREGNGFYTPTPNSGIADVGVPGTGSRASIRSQALESSNVDLAQEFVDMISVQKLFQANTKVITSAQEIINNVIQLVR
jgi:flagellar hook protein FlgE